MVDDPNEQAPEQPREPPPWQWTERPDRPPARRAASGWLAVIGALTTGAVVLAVLLYAAPPRSATRDAAPAAAGDPAGPVATALPVPLPTAASPSPTGPVPVSRASSRVARTSPGTPTATATTRPPRAHRLVLVGPGDTEEFRLMLEYYCHEERDSATVRLDPGDGPAVHGWRCQGRRDSEPIDLTQACVWNYGGDLVARFSDPDDAMSWRCFRRA